MTGDPDVIGLLQRADWTRLSISARVKPGEILLVGILIGRLGRKGHTKIANTADC